MHKIGIKFDKQGKEYFFLSAQPVTDQKYAVVFSGDVESIVEITNTNPVCNRSIDEMKTIVRIATEQDIAKHKENKEKEKDYHKQFADLIKKHQLNMTPITTTISLNGDKVLFQYLADERVDFRELLKDLNRIFKTRIELNQIGPRDKAKIVGGIGICGEKLCCSNHMTSFNSVSIKMAKNQNMSLNPDVVTGCCGRLKCCIEFEDKTYTEEKKDLPAVGSFINYKGESWKVLSTDPISKKLKIRSKFTQQVIDASEVV